MGTGPPTSVLLPTVTWTEACGEVLAQLRPADELLVVCDSPSDPVFDRRDDLAENADVIAAGEPEGCSGKCNAIAEGMVEASKDRIVWTDDDFHHPPDWLDQLQTEYEEQGATTELPHFVGRDALAKLFEPMYAFSGTAAVYAGDVAWGGALIFDRGDIDEDGFLHDLRRTVSDDGTLGDHLAFTPVKRTRLVEVGGSIRETLERHVRFTQLAWRHDTTMMAVAGVLGALLTVAYVLFPAFGVVASTVFYGVIYAAFGMRRWTFLLGYPVTLLQIPLLVYGLARRTFVWGGRRYRWRSMFDVEIVE